MPRSRTLSSLLFPFLFGIAVSKSVVTSSTDCHDGVLYKVSAKDPTSLVLTETGECCTGFRRVDDGCQVCPSGWTGPACDDPCPEGQFGPGCTLPCSCPQCDSFTGSCPGEGSFLDEALRRLRWERLSSARAVVAFCLVVILLVVVTGLSSFIAYHYYYRKQRSVGGEDMQRMTGADDQTSLYSDCPARET